MTLWTMTDIAGTYRAASHLIPFGTSRGLAYPTVTSHIFLGGWEEIYCRGQWRKGLHVAYPFILF